MTVRVYSLHLLSLQHKERKKAKDREPQKSILVVTH